MRHRCYAGWRGREHDRVQRQAIRHQFLHGHRRKSSTRAGTAYMYYISGHRKRPFLAPRCTYSSSRSLILCPPQVEQTQADVDSAPRHRSSATRCGISCGAAKRRHLFWCRRVKPAPCADYMPCLARQSSVQRSVVINVSRAAVSQPAPILYFIIAIDRRLPSFERGRHGSQHLRYLVPAEMMPKPCTIRASHALYDTRCNDARYRFCATQQNAAARNKDVGISYSTTIR